MSETTSVYTPNSLAVNALTKVSTALAFISQKINKLPSSPAIFPFPLYPLPALSTPCSYHETETTHPDLESSRISPLFAMTIHASGGRCMSQPLNREAGNTGGSRYLQKEGLSSVPYPDLYFQWKQQAN